MGELVSMPGVQPQAPIAGRQPVPGLIRVMEELLDKARTGELQSFVGTGFFADGGRLAMWADHHPNRYEMLGALVSLTDEFTRRRPEEDLEEDPEEE